MYKKWRKFISCALEQRVNIKVLGKGIHSGKVKRCNLARMRRVACVPFAIRRQFSSTKCYRRLVEISRSQRSVLEELSDWGCFRGYWIRRTDLACLCIVCTNWSLQSRFVPGTKRKFHESPFHIYFSKRKTMVRRPFYNQITLVDAIIYHWSCVSIHKSSLFL